jgi:mannose/cellobiose epimerase-like protein (N-acyl-D-glucosamine 2-epimerase family)
MQPTSEDAAKAIDNCWSHLRKHRARTHDGTFRRGGYPLGSGGIESSNTCICHVRLKRSGAWWYEASSNQMLALRCAKYSGTFHHVCARYRQEK